MDISNQQKSPHVGHSGDGDEKFVSGLSTVMVTAVQEAKDRTSLIEFISLQSALPNFSEESEMHADILLLEKLQYMSGKKRKVSSSSKSKSSIMKRYVHLSTASLLKAERSKILKTVPQLEEKLMQKPMEVDGGMELHGNLVQLLELKDFVAVSEEKQQKEHERRMDILLAKLDSIENKICALQAELHERNEEISKVKDLQAELHRQIESQALKITNSEAVLRDNETEKKCLAVQLEHMKASLDGLKENLRQKTSKVECEESASSPQKCKK